MKEKVGSVYSIAQDNPWVTSCTVSKEVMSQVSYYSLAENTDISAEIYPYYKLIYVHTGRAVVYTNDDEKTVNVGEAIIAKTNIPVGIKTDQGTIYTEIMIGENSMMNSAVKPGEVFGLKDLVPYQDGKIVNMDVAHNEKMKFVVMAFDAGTGLSEHAAPGEALVFALDGSATIIYEGVPHEIHAGEQFCFAKGGLHAVKANEKFKMALLLTL